MISTVDIENFSIALLEKKHNRNSFCSEVDSLDYYLKERASQDAKRKIAVTYVLENTVSHDLIGYYTLSSTVIEVHNLSEDISRKLPAYPYVPSTLTGRLAVDKKYQGKGFGEILLVDALKRSYHASLAVASFAIIVDVISSSAEQFYKKYGFMELTDEEDRLFLPMKTISSL